MRNCIDEGTLQTWFDGELAASEAAKITAHLNACVRCAEAARTLEAENSILSAALSNEFAAVVPSERLRQRVNAAVDGLQVGRTPRMDRSWISAIRDLLPRFRVLGYASATAAVLLAAALTLVYLKQDQPAAVTANERLPEIATAIPKNSPEAVAKPVGTKPLNPLPPRAARSVRKKQAAEEQATSLAWQERQYEGAIAKLNEAIKAEAPLRPSLQVEYEYNLALIDNAIATTRDVAKKNPKDPQATQFMLAAYQTKIDLMNQIADARSLER
jgi:hypothetical protein